MFISEGNKWWLLEALNPFNMMSSRRGKAAVVFNALRGLEFKKEQSNDNCLQIILSCIDFFIQAFA